MANLNYEQLAVAALDALLAGGLEIIQHYYDPDPTEWYFKGPMGNVGPFETPEAAIKAAIHALYSQLAEQTAAAAALGEELAALRAKLDQADGGDGWSPGGGPWTTRQMRPEHLRYWIAERGVHGCPMLERCATMPAPEHPHAPGLRAPRVFFCSSALLITHDCLSPVARLVPLALSIFHSGRNDQRQRPWQQRQGRKR